MPYTVTVMRYAQNVGLDRADTQRRLRMMTGRLSGCWLAERLDSSTPDRCRFTLPYHGIVNSCKTAFIRALLSSF
jgi:hypothetical protein